MKELNQDNLNEIIQNSKNVVIQYGASWCGACRVTKPKFSALKDEYQDIEFYYVDAEKFPNSRALATVNNLPTFATFKNGELIGQATGTNINKVKEIINEIANN